MSQLRIATFNLLHGQPLAPDGAPRPYPADPGGPLAEAVAALDADVLALQEVDRHQARSGGTDQAAVAAKAMGAADWRFAAALHGRPAPVAGWVPDLSVPAGIQVYGPGEVGDDAPPAYGTALLTRLPVLHWRARRFAPAPFGLPLRVAGRRGLTPVPDEPRAALAAVLEGGNGPFTVVAAHLSFVPGWNMAQLAGIRRWIADLPQPYLVLGDFNLIGAVPRTVLGSAAALDRTAPRAKVRELRAARRARPQFTDARRRRVREPRARLQGWYDLARTPTYPSHRPAVQFDHVLAIGVPRAAVGPAAAPLTGVSDHRPLVVEASL
ncbi:MULTISPECIES: endonuclease/exonuclease/phosphatase family protein [unclassified Streptomyces]|uniref:endonuclease/exonuclease/phosphatase family protein n=1 Tax=Streptomycetaceae TaxID=2062 RepID=UPI002E75FBC7|nr:MULTISPECIES: endonuclease/exonuclease/phosphatase family protein [unclassified Streptomyces]MED7950033.1 endonuclease/exonuclease/phosphatase family protein [Streptomyces sp. BE303]MEE1826981.1 endonuclease/exonuclease/phosphatase family protein [Streptomyces sp. BE20]